MNYSEGLHNFLPLEVLVRDCMSDVLSSVKIGSCAQDTTGRLQVRITAKMQGVSLRANIAFGPSTQRRRQFPSQQDMVSHWVEQLSMLHTNLVDTVED